MTDDVLQVRGARFGYGRLDVVHGVDIDVRPRELVALVGRNGVGKSTLCLGIAGVRHSRAHGSITWRGDELMRLAPDEIVKRGISLVPEGRRIFRRLTVRENLELGRFSLGRGRGRRSGGIDLALEMFPILKTFSNRRAGELSGGQQQMIAIGQALAGDPTLLILDDPCAGLAESVVEELYRVIHLLRERVGILIVDQVIPRALAQSQRCYVMEAGRIELSGDSAGVADNPQLERIVMGELGGSGTPEQVPATLAPDGRGTGTLEE